MATITMSSTRQLMAPTPDKLAQAGALHTMLQGWLLGTFEFCQYNAFAIRAGTNAFFGCSCYLTTCPSRF
jgi:hypothetical protein